MMGLGEMVTITQSLSDEEIELIADRARARGDDQARADEERAPGGLRGRPGGPRRRAARRHDHGPRRPRQDDAARRDPRDAVVETEAGGITQHIGAYQVDHNGRRITFLDTPGHEAFTALRARGAKVTDIAVLVVAADDGVMPQTKESINHARAAEVPIVVAVNKIDLPDANPDARPPGARRRGPPAGGVGRHDAVLRRLREEKQNLDDLLEKMLLVADAELELKANPKAEASGPIIESRLDVGRGPVATMLVQRGTLRVGDAIVAGDAWGKVRALHDLPRREGQGGAPGRSGRDPRLRQAAAGGRARARRRERAPGAPSRAAARPAAAPRAARAAPRRRRLARGRSSRRCRRAPSRT